MYCTVIYTEQYFIAWLKCQLIQKARAKNERDAKQCIKKRSSRIKLAFTVPQAMDDFIVNYEKKKHSSYTAKLASV
jgi:hypothetical protein